MEKVFHIENVVKAFHIREQQGSVRICLEKNIPVVSIKRERVHPAKCEVSSYGELESRNKH